MNNTRQTSQSQINIKEKSIADKLRLKYEISDAQNILDQHDKK